ncbi:putative LRR receptor-like serine/threonine-protein kinase [Salvia divinorum]|uniref:non-specific serine/threonine protein kinase n=1 Tax=Salvia divinorum TaxID=28513 RepID=A0ABD1G0Q1_SALDI
MEKIILVLATLVLICDSQLLPQDEVDVLQTISSKLQNTYWENVNRSSCHGGFNFTGGIRNVYSRVVCDCSFNNGTVCHVTHMQLRGLNLTGTLPEEFVELSHLQELDFTLNYLYGSIPKIFGQLRLATLSLLGNHISGEIPAEIGNITTLKVLILEDNLLEGNLPENLGSLRNLERLLLSANNFSGTIPVTFGNLRNLTDFRIDGSRMSGKIPDFIEKWSQLTRLDLQGTSMEGPIPAAISRLEHLTDLRISDVEGATNSFPNLQRMRAMKYLILRNCSINDTIPAYLGDMAELDTLDLSFNMLNGEIPNTIGELAKLRFMFLSHNSLAGEIPAWIMNSRQNMDVSYNSFTRPSVSSCRQFSNVNLVASHSNSSSKSTLWCLKRDLHCASNPGYTSVFINCGGGKVSFEGNEYEENAIDAGPSHFESTEKWAYSSTGIYLANDRGRFVAENSTPMLSQNATIYETARLSPSSLKYYGLCLRRGSYRVRLHFAEIIFSDDSKFSSNGRRIFDVAIQGSVVLTDFNIAEEAKGVRKGIYRDFDVFVNGGTLEIHLYWRGKGTTAIPDRGVYGPLISAIAVMPNFDVSTGLSATAITGIILSSAAAVLLILCVIGGKGGEDKELRGLDGYFTLKEIKEATNNFDNANKIGEGGFGPVYKGTLSNGTAIAVKQLSSRSKQGNREFLNEMGMISALQHPNLVRLLGCCIEANQLILIYEYLENNCLGRALFGCPDQRLDLGWSTRKRICLGIARGLAYLHEESRLKIIHRDIKATNVLLDKDLNAKISDFGLAKLGEEGNAHISTRVAGTVGYMAPEYAMRGYLTDKADVYSFGIVALEIVSGKSNTFFRPEEEFVYLLDWAYVLQERGSLLELVDPRLGSGYSEEEAMGMLNLALLCASPSPTLRPSMSSVVGMLQGAIPVQAPAVGRCGADEEAFGGSGLLMDGPWIGSSVSHSTSKEESRDYLDGLFVQTC